MTKPKITVREMCYIGVFVALAAAMAQVSVPLPWGVPVTMQTLVIMLMGVVLGSKKGAIAASIYLLVGLAGVPVFSMFRGGFQMLVGPTGGFLLTFPLMAFIAGLGVEKLRCVKGVPVYGLLLAMAVNYIGGTIMFCAMTGSSLPRGLALCVLPYIPADIVKAAVAGTLGVRLRERGLAV